MARLFTNAFIDHIAILATSKNVTISRPGFFRFSLALRHRRHQVFKTNSVCSDVCTIEL